MYETVKTKLQNFPEFRERSLRVKYLSKLALRNCGLETSTLEEGWKEPRYLLTLLELAEFAMAYTSYDRAWRKVLEDHEELRGRDYSDKAMLEEKKLIELGYEPTP